MAHFLWDGHFSSSSVHSWDRAQLLHLREQPTRTYSQLHWPFDLSICSRRLPRCPPPSTLLIHTNLPEHVTSNIWFVNQNKLDLFFFCNQNKRARYEFEYFLFIFSYQCCFDTHIDFTYLQLIKFECKIVACSCVHIIKVLIEHYLAQIMLAKSSLIWGHFDGDYLTIN